jgi:hypothetical protein
MTITTAFDAMDSSSIGSASALASAADKADVIELFSRIIDNLNLINGGGINANTTTGLINDSKCSEITEPATSPYVILYDDELIEPDNSSAIFTVKLPPSGSTDISIGQKFLIKDGKFNATAMNITIDRNGNTIDLQATNGSITTNGGFREYTYKGANNYSLTGYYLA